MKALLIALSCIALVSFPLFADEAKATGTVKNVTPDEAEKLIKENPKMVILDVRTPEEFAKGHIHGAKNIDFNEDDFSKKVATLDPATPILVHCAAGGRSSQALADLKDKKTIYHLNKGFSAWEKAGKPVETGAKK
jgi:rhodanese-related sulfurtransferase